jgi:hypothetical protein
VAQGVGPKFKQKKKKKKENEKTNYLYNEMILSNRKKFWILDTHSRDECQKHLVE